MKLRLVKMETPDWYKVVNQNFSKLGAFMYSDGRVKERAYYVDKRNEQKVWNCFLENIRSFTDSKN